MAHIHNSAGSTLFIKNVVQGIIGKHDLARLTREAARTTGIHTNKIAISRTVVNGIIGKLQTSGHSTSEIDEIASVTNYIGVNGIANGYRLNQNSVAGIEHTLGIIGNITPVNYNGAISIGQCLIINNSLITIGSRTIHNQITQR